MGKIIFLEDIPTIVKQLKDQGSRIILAGGCFDILHQGHLDFLASAKDLGGELMVLLESDETVKRLKGEGRPIHTQRERARMLSFLKNVDYVVCLPPLNSDLEYLNLVKLLRPDIIAVTKGDPLLEKKNAHAKAINGRVVEVIARKQDYSTTEIAKKIS